MKRGRLRSYSFYGCRLQTELSLSFACEGAGDDLSPAIALTQGEVPDALAGAVWSSPVISLSGDGTALIQVEAVGRFLVESGRSITLQLKPGATASKQKLS